ncbi:1-phosphatidylinositol-3-phosphate 5-kinase [Moniliophthora roreri]|nr:1-phosphatidylinositol-3-phosphate 5-kinase [Moniliophthora roreri]
MEDKPLPALPQPNPFVSIPAVPSTPANSQSGPASIEKTKPRKNAARKAPNSYDLTTLCVQARVHRGRFIQFVLDEVAKEQELNDAVWLERNKDELSGAIEDGLDELGRCMGQGGWLAGVRRARELFDSQSQYSSDLEIEEKESIIAQLRQIAAHPLPPTPVPISKHMLLCLADVGGRIALPEEDTGFDIVPSQIRCIFKPNIFIFPDSTASLGDRLLYGYNEWNSTLSTNTLNLRLVGGTFQFTSVPGSPSFHGSLAKILKLTIYHHISLLLEQHLLSDARVPLVFASPSLANSYHPRNRVVSHGAVGSPERPKLAEQNHSFNSGYNGQKKGYASKPSLIPNSIFSFFSKQRSLGRANSLSGSPVAGAGSELPIAIRGSSLDLRGSSRPDSGIGETAPSRPSTDATSFQNPGYDGIGSRIRRFSFTHSPFSVKSLSATSPDATTPIQSTIVTDTPSKPFTHLLERLRETRDLLSTSPGVGQNIELPTLIARLADRERESATGGKVRGDERVALRELLGWGEDGSTDSQFVDKDKKYTNTNSGPNISMMLGMGMLGTKGFLKHQALSMLVSVHVPTKASGPHTVEEFQGSDDENETGTTENSSQFSSSNEDFVAHAIREQQESTSTSKATSVTATSTFSTSVSAASSTKPRKTERKRKAHQKYIPCPAQQPRWETYPFKGKDSKGDGGGPCVGEIVLEWLQGAEDICCLCSPLHGFPHQVRKGKEKEKPVNDGKPDKIEHDKHHSTSDLTATASAGSAPNQSGSVNKATRKHSAVPVTGSSCKVKRGDHETRFMHGSKRVTVTVSQFDASRKRPVRSGSQSVKSGSTSQLTTNDTKGPGITATLPVIPPITRAKSDTGVIDNGDQGSNAKVTKKSSEHEDEDEDEDNEDGRVEMWMSCAICGKDNWDEDRSEMSDGTYLLPFGKFLELLIYSPHICTVETPLCEHILSPPTASHPRTESIPLSPLSATSPFSPTSSELSFDQASAPSLVSNSNVARQSRHKASLGSVTAARNLSRGLGWSGVGGIRKSSSLRNPSPVPSEEEDGNDVTPTPSRVVSASKQASDKPDSTIGARPNQREEAESTQLFPRSEDPDSTDSRFNIIRHFTNRKHTVSFSIGKIEDVFELRVPRVQIVRGMSVLGGQTGHSLDPTIRTMGDDKFEMEQQEAAEKKKLRKEIKTWWEGVADHIDSLEDKLAMDSGENREKFRKSLPRLPSEDEAYSDVDNQRSDVEMPTPKPEGLPGSPSTPTAKHANYFGKQEFGAEEAESTSSSTPKGTPKLKRPPLPTTTSSNSIVSKESLSSSSEASVSLSPSSSSQFSPKEKGSNPTQVLSDLRQTFHRMEQSLYDQLAETSSGSLNRVRRAFWVAAKSAERQLAAWQKKHLGLGLKIVGLRPDGKGKEKETKESERENTRKDSNKLSLLVVEPEWWDKTSHVVPEGSTIIREDDWGSIIAFTLSTASYRQELSAMSESTVRPSSPAPNSPFPSSSLFASAGYKLFRGQSQTDEDEPEYSEVISRTRDPVAGLLSIREVLRQKPGDTISMSSRIARESSRLLGSALGSGGLSMPRTATPTSPYSKPDVQVSKDSAGGEVISGLPTRDASVDKILQELGASSRPGSAMSLSFEDVHIRRGKNSVISAGESSSTLEPDDASAAGASDPGSLYSAAANKGSYLPPPPVPTKDVAHPVPATASTASSHPFSTLTGGLTNVMRAMLSNTVELRQPSAKHHLLSAEMAPIDDRPHIKYDWTIGKKLKFSVTVYYAKEFEILRKRFGVDDVFLKSLSHTSNWSAEGGKSNDRFVIKTLVNAWNVADLQVLLDLAPSYFRYLDSTACKATALAKLLGFYTIEIRDLGTGTIRAKSDLLVMENLFYKIDKIDKIFDLKGIEGRRVKTGANSSKTLFDGEWIEGQQQTLTLVQPHSKLVLREAIRNDAAFLARSNIMDYSLLLGVDTQHKLIVTGLVDTIVGSYTFAKNLEHKAKKGLSAGKEVTVIPPAEYQERFVNSIERYFIACPDKWSKPLDPSSRIINDLDSLSHIF